MLRLLGLLAYVLVSISIGMTSVAHATEPAGGLTIAASEVALIAEVGHSQGDSDEVPADSDSRFPHHHLNCHGDHNATPLGFAGAVLADVRPGDVVPSKPFPLLSHPAAPALRPPRA